MANVLNTDAELSGKRLLVVENAQTVTGLQTFDRDPNPPFAVTSGSAAVSNLDADKLDGQHATDIIASAAPPAGSIVAYGGSAAPSGWLLCNGAAVSRTTFSALFAILGTAYGAGDGSTTFNVPNLKQRFPLGKADSGTGATLGATGGAIDHVHSGPSHTHGVGTLAVSGDGANQGDIFQQGSGRQANVVAHTHSLTGATAAGGTGDTGAANPPFQVVNYIIKT